MAIQDQNDIDTGSFFNTSLKDRLNRPNTQQASYIDQPRRRNYANRIQNHTATGFYKGNSIVKQQEEKQRIQAITLLSSQMGGVSDTFTSKPS